MSSMRSLGISFVSLALTAAVIANAYYQKKQFYPSVVYITKSNPSMAVIYCQAFICVFLTGKLMSKIFFGELRASEFEHLMERSWYAITETCLAFTVFKDDFNPKFVALFTLLLFLKSFHWLAEDRVDYMERSPIIGWLFHVRVLSLLLVLAIFDLHFVEHSYHSTVTKGASVQLVFGFEYAILMMVTVNVAIKYALYSIDLNSEAPWENKAVFLLYTELVMGFIKVVLYLAFVAIMIRIYTLPLFAFRPMYYTIQNFRKAFNDVRLSRRAIHNMNTLYPDATSEELSSGDNVCIICREEMNSGCKKLPCNHIFHTACLRSWFQRQQTCPTCRLNILGTAPTNNQRRHQRPANVPPPFAPNPFPFANAFPGANLFQPFNLRNLQQQQQNQPAPPNEPVGDNNAPRAQAEGAPVPPGVNFPPFPFMAPFMAAPPMPPRNLESMTTDELRQLEGNERQNVEARIQWLRNIQVMLDTAVIMLQQYNTAITLSASSTQQQATTEPNVASQAPVNEPTTSSARNSSPKAGPSAPVTANSSALPTTSSQASASASFTAVSDPTSTSVPTMHTDTVKNEINQDEHVSSEDEIRRKRLQKFEQQTAQS